jgi:hypothetical protein
MAEITAEQYKKIMTEKKALFVKRKELKKQLQEVRAQIKAQTPKVKRVFSID